MSLEIDNLSYAYQGKMALEEVSFSAARSEITGILGPNGSGKTTLLKCINNILPANCKNIQYNSLNLKQLSIRQRSKYISYVPQENSSTFPISVIETIMMGRIPHYGRKLTTRDKDIAFEMLELMELTDMAFRKINQISGGERQRVFIARALAQQTPIILMDEPTNNLDLKNQTSALEILSEIVKQKEIIALISLHDINLASMFSDKIMMLKDHKIFKCGEPLEVITEETLKDVYEVDTQVLVESNGIYVKLLKSGNSLTILSKRQ